jgi:hypothetical protein
VCAEQSALTNANIVGLVFFEAMALKAALLHVKSQTEVRSDFP